ncbi:hypothetical protein [Phenylobacterium sp.]|uniref:hypothetical protein n=1 Tax=Phenylobacterium sp. TaxID=1871053 RepID=UPI002BA7785C|nr:hypothetical protein [Phenylobacterium sp.]HVI34057.1 hypothetical protein [Phenylobacterium sp.]
MRDAARPGGSRTPAEGRLTVLQSLGMVAVVLGAASIPAYVILTTWLDRRAVEADWTISGPACPQVAALDPAVVGRKPAKVFSYQKVRFARQSGHVSCVTLDAGGPFQRRTYPVCQFSGPAGVGVTTAEGTVFYQPGAAQRVTVSVRDGRPACVMAGWFRH